MLFQADSLCNRAFFTSNAVLTDSSGSAFYGSLRLFNCQPGNQVSAGKFIPQLSATSKSLLIKIFWGVSVKLSSQFMAKLSFLEEWDPF